MEWNLLFEIVELKIPKLKIKITLNSETKIPKIIDKEKSKNLFFSWTCCYSARARVGQEPHYKNSNWPMDRMVSNIKLKDLSAVAAKSISWQVDHQNPVCKNYFSKPYSVTTMLSKITRRRHWPYLPNTVTREINCRFSPTVAIWQKRDEAKILFVNYFYAFY